MHAQHINWSMQLMHTEKPRPVSQAGLRSRGSVAVLAACPGPDEAEGLFAAFDDRVIEEGGVDRLGEARIVQLEAQVAAALIRGLGLSLPR